jgi:hypothetical protein
MALAHGKAGRLDHRAGAERPLCIEALEYGDTMAIAGKLDGGGETGNARADDGDVEGWLRQGRNSIRERLRTK